MTKIIDGTKIAAEIRSELKMTVSRLSGRKPGLAFVLVGHHAPSQSYVKMKKKACEEVGILSEILHLPEETTQEELLEHLKRLNQDQTIDGILVQQPLPKQINTTKIVQATSVEKDVDGFHPMNIGRVLLGLGGGNVACTPLGVLTLLERANIDPTGQEVVIVGRSNIVGKPLAALLVQNSPYRNATVTIAHSATRNLAHVTSRADLLIAALGKPRFITGEMVKEGGVVIDVGINRIQSTQGKAEIVGDVDYESVAPKCKAITPVPGGVGPMTIAMLLSNTLMSYVRREKIAL